jgi:DNA repair photolyase
MKIVYEPKGEAREYAELAANLYGGCVHGCRYCYAPDILRKKRGEFFVTANPRRFALDNWEADCREMRRKGDTRRVLLSFACDPYQPAEEHLHLTRNALMVASAYSVGVDVLTKGSAALVARDFDLMAQVGTRVGVSLSWAHDAYRKEWEPNASGVDERIGLLRDAKLAGLGTWVSMEPVIRAHEALELIPMAAQYADRWLVGKLNHDREVEAMTDWRGFLSRAVMLFERMGATYTIKRSLRTAALGGR